jgi:hypothetical protein
LQIIQSGGATVLARPQKPAADNSNTKATVIAAVRLDIAASSQLRDVMLKN